MGRPYRLLILLSAVLWLAFLTGTAAAQRQDTPFLLEAAEIIYDDANNRVTAIGNVEISDEQRILLADKITYRLDTGEVEAIGNISLMEPSGDVLFAERMYLDQTLKAGFIEGIRILFTDQSRFAAVSGERFGDGGITLTKAVFSPCPICKEDGDEPPLWQIKAEKVTVNPAGEHVRYRNAVLELKGLPILYTPFFQHTDPRVKRKTGFLVPSYGSNSELGLTLEVPYFINLAPNRDLTLSPIITTEVAPVLTGEYRARTESGSYKLAGSITNPEERGANNERVGGRELRGHVKGSGRFELSPIWDWGFNLSRSSDDTYLRRYEFSEEDTLTSSLFIEGRRNRDFASAQAYVFQGLREDDDPGQTPIVAPLVDYLYYDDTQLPAFLGIGGRFAFAANMVSLYRTDGTDSRRVSVNADWQRQFISSWGGVLMGQAELRGDLYHINDFSPGMQTGSEDSDLVGRLWPTVTLDARYPLINTRGPAQTVIEPIAQIVIAPNGGNRSDIPNEDSQTLEFDDTNLFSSQRFPGFDRVENGARLNYGVKTTVFSDNGASGSLLIGQVLRLRDTNDFAAASGLNGTRSDLVASIELTPSPFLDLVARLRLDRDDLSLRRNEIYTSFGPDYLRFTVNYVKLAESDVTDTLGAREEIYATGRAKLTPNWFISAESRRDLTVNGGQIRTGVGLGYEDDCFVFGLEFLRRFTRDRDVEPSSSIKLRLALKHLG